MNFVFLILPDVGEEDFNDSFSDSEDYNATVVTDPPNLNRKLSEANLLTESVSGSRPASGPLTASLFPYVPPYITFADHIGKGPAMPAAVTKVLKWKLTTITPIVIRKVLANTGFRLLRSECVMSVAIFFYFKNFRENSNLPIASQFY